MPPVSAIAVIVNGVKPSIVAVDQVMIVTGQLLAYTNNALIAHLYGESSSWRWMLLLASIPAIGLWVGMRLMPESPRWYVAQNREADARRSLERVAAEHVDAQIDEIRSTIDKSDSQESLGWAALRRPWVLRIFWHRLVLRDRQNLHSRHSGV